MNQTERQKSKGKQFLEFLGDVLATGGGVRAWFVVNITFHKLPSYPETSNFGGLKLNKNPTQMVSQASASARSSFKNGNIFQLTYYKPWSHLTEVINNHNTLC